jgi:nitrous oxidase accessory protein NosD
MHSNYSYASTCPNWRKYVCFHSRVCCSLFRFVAFQLFSQPINASIRPGTPAANPQINAAIATATANDTVTVHRGTYAEDVIIGKPLALLGSNAVINAAGRENGINVDGLGHPGLSNVVVSGFTVANANYQGILVTNATNVTIRDNHVTGNDVKLQPFAAGGPVCPGIRAEFVAGEGFDCGEGIHLSAVTNSIVSGNVVEHNAGGILVLFEKYRALRCWWRRRESCRPGATIWESRSPRHW